MCLCAYSSRTQDKKGATRKWKWRYCNELVQFAFSSPHLMKQNSGQQGQYGKKGERSRFRRDFKTSSKIDGESLIFLCEIWGKQKLTGENNLQNYKTFIKFLSIMFWFFLKRFLTHFKALKSRSAFGISAKWSMNEDNKGRLNWGTEFQLNFLSWNMKDLSSLGLVSS